METLPARISCPRRIVRTHRPTACNQYERYRPCLRLEFKFTCAFCLVHESDMRIGLEAGESPEGTGLFTIEHHLRQDPHKHLICVYTNLLYACKKCNRARGTKEERDALGRRLLEPCAADWSSHFEVREDGTMVVIDPNDVHAAYTHWAYDLGNDTKNRLRNARRAVLEEHERRLQRANQTMQAALGLLGKLDDSPERTELLTQIKEARADCERDKAEVSRRLAAVPADAPVKCRCLTRAYKRRVSPAK